MAREDRRRPQVVSWRKPDRSRQVGSPKKLLGAGLVACVAAIVILLQPSRQPEAHFRSFYCEVHAGTGLPFLPFGRNSAVGLGVRFGSRNHAESLTGDSVPSETELLEGDDTVVAYVSTYAKSGNEGIWLRDGDDRGERVGWIPLREFLDGTRPTLLFMDCGWLNGLPDRSEIESQLTAEVDAYGSPLWIVAADPRDRLTDVLPGRGRTRFSLAVEETLASVESELASDDFLQRFKTICEQQGLSWPMFSKTDNRVRIHAIQSPADQPQEPESLAEQSDSGHQLSSGFAELSEMWRLAELVEAGDGIVRPICYAPEAWFQLQSLLLDYDQRIRGTATDYSETDERIELLVSGLASIATSESQTFSPEIAAVATISRERVITRNRLAEMSKKQRSAWVRFLAVVGQYNWLLNRGKRYATWRQYSMSEKNSLDKDLHSMIQYLQQTALILQTLVVSPVNHDNWGESYQRADRMVQAATEVEAKLAASLRRRMSTAVAADMDRETLSEVVAQLNFLVQPARLREKALGWLNQSGRMAPASGVPPPVRDHKPADSQAIIDKLQFIHPIYPTAVGEPTGPGFEPVDHSDATYESGVVTVKKPAVPRRPDLRLLIRNLDRNELLPRSRLDRNTTFTRLVPYAHRANAFALELHNQSSESVEVRVKVISAPATHQATWPRGRLLSSSGRLAGRVLEAFETKLYEIEELGIPGTAHVRLSFSQETEQMSPGSSWDVSHGICFRISTTDELHRWEHWVEVLPRHAGAALRPMLHVGNDIKLAFIRLDAGQTRLPEPDRPIHVSGEVAFPGGNSGLQQQWPETELISSTTFPVALTAEARQMYLSVDGYPRAMVFSLPRQTRLGAGARSLPDISNEQLWLDLQIDQRQAAAETQKMIIESSGRVLFRPTDQPAMLRLRVQAPPELFRRIGESPTDSDTIEIRVNKELVARRYDDRNFQTQMSATPSGIQLLPVVSDWSIPIRFLGREDQLVEVSAQIRRKGSLVQTNQLEVKVDRNAPQIWEFGVVPARQDLVQGTTAIAFVRASDEGGVKSVDLEIESRDPLRGYLENESILVRGGWTGTFWKATSPTSKLHVGRHRIRALARDRLGHQSTSHFHDFTIVKKEDPRAPPDPSQSGDEKSPFAATKKQPPTAMVHGFVALGTRRPKGAKVWIEQDPKIRVLTDERGRFRINGLPKSPITLLAELNFKGLTRRGKISDVLANSPDKAEPIRVDLSP